MIRGIIFDCFGVIITDTLLPIIQAKRAENPKDADELQALVHAVNKGIISSDEYARQLSEKVGITVEEYRAIAKRDERKDQKLLAFIKELRRDYKTALLSNISAQGLARRFSDEELAEHFDVVVASGAVGYVKPEPEIYQLTCARLGLEPEECLFTDDLDMYVRGAEEQGLYGIVYQNFGQFTRDLSEALETA